MEYAILADIAMIIFADYETFESDIRKVIVSRNVAEPSGCDSLAGGGAALASLS